MTKLPAFLTVRQAADELGVSTQRVRDLLKEGKLTKVHTPWPPQFVKRSEVAARKRLQERARVAR